MKINTGMTGMESAREKRTSRNGNRYLSERNAGAVSSGNSAWMMYGSRLQEKLNPEDGDTVSGNEEGEGSGVNISHQSDAEKIYQAAVNGKQNPLWAREVPKVPYGRLAKDGVIVYNGVCFVCDEKTNSICLGDMTDEENVLTIPLSKGGHLKVNRNSIGLLSKAAGMFSPEDLNLIMRAISEDTRIQAIQKEIEDEDASIGNRIGQDGQESQAEEQEESQ